MRTSTGMQQHWGERQRLWGWERLGAAVGRAAPAKVIAMEPLSRASLAARAVPLCRGGKTAALAALGANPHTSGLGLLQLVQSPCTQQRAPGICLQLFSSISLMLGPQALLWA